MPGLVIILFCEEKKLPKKNFVSIAWELCVAARIDVLVTYRKILGQRLTAIVRICLVVFNEKLDSMVSVIWEYSSE